MTRKKKKRLIFAGIGFVILAAAAICLYNMPISLGGTGVARPAPLPGGYCPVFPAGAAGQAADD